MLLAACIRKIDPKPESFWQHKSRSSPIRHWDRITVVSKILTQPPRLVMASIRNIVCHPSLASGISAMIYGPDERYVKTAGFGLLKASVSLQFALRAENLARWCY